MNHNKDNMLLVRDVKILGAVASPNGKTFHSWGLVCQTNAKSDGALQEEYGSKCFCDHRERTIPYWTRCHT